MPQIEIFLSLLRSGMYGNPIPPAELPESIDWKAITKLARKHTVLGIIIDALQFLPESLRPAGELRAKMNKFALGLIQANLVLEQTAARLVEFFKKYDISGVLLKGQGVARYYRQPQIRHSGDIDFYVGTSSYKKAFEVCRHENLIKPGVKLNKTDQHFAFNFHGAPIEIHRIASRIFTPYRNRHFQQWVTEELEHSPQRRALTVGDTDITLPSCDFDAIYIFYHAWRHYLEGGIGLRQVCDWAMIFHTHASDIDTEKLKQNIRRFGLTGGWRLFACIAVNHLGIPAGKIPLYDPRYSHKSEKVFEEIMTGGNFGYYSEEYIRFKSYGYTGMRYATEKTLSYTKSFLTLLPVIPSEATFLYFRRLFNGPLRLLRRSKQ